MFNPLPDLRMPILTNRRHEPPLSLNLRILSRSAIEAFQHAHGPLTEP